jgi:hypothetical protein
MRRVPGRKTDVSDAQGIAQLIENGLVRPSFVPPEPIRRLRDLSRYRTALTQERTREIQRLHDVLEDAGIKLSCVATDVMGRSGRSMLAALVAGERESRCSPTWHWPSCENPGVSERIAEVIIAETGAEISHFRVNAIILPLTWSFCPPTSSLLCLTQ